MKKVSIGKVFIYIALILWAITTIYPFFWVINNSFKSSNEILTSSFSFPLDASFSNYENAFSKTNIIRAYANSFIISGTVTICVLILSSMAAYVMVRFNFKGKKIIYALFLGSLMIPAFSTIVPIFKIVASYGLINKHIAVIIPQIAGNLSFAIIVLMGFMTSVPIELEESAYLEGCSIFQIYRKIVLPLTLPALSSVAIFTFLWSYNDLFLQMIILKSKDVMPISALLKEISSQFGTDYGLMAASVTLVVLPILVIYVFLQKYIIKGMTEGALKG